MPEQVEFHLPFELSINPHYEEVSVGHTQWARSVNLLPPIEAHYEQYEAWGFPRMMALAFPAATKQNLDLAVRTLGWSFVWDDQLEQMAIRAPSLAAQHIRDIVDTSRAGYARHGGSHAECIWASLLNETGQDMTQHWRNRAVQSFTRNAVAYLYEGQDNKKGSPASWAHYSEMRRGSGGMDITMNLLESWLECEVPFLAHEAPQLHRLFQITNNFTTWSNDVYSAEKDEIDGVVNNAVFVVERDMKCSRREAVDTIIAKSRTEITDFERIKEGLPDALEMLLLDPEERDRVLRYVRGLESWMRGYHEWQQETHRYRGQASKFGRPIPAENLMLPGCGCATGKADD